MVSTPDEESAARTFDTMGYFFTLLYLLTAYITPTVLFGPLSEYHVEVLVVFLAIVTSLPSVVRSEVLGSSQMVAYVGMSLAIIISFAQTGWLGGAAAAAYGFMQPSFGFLLVAINCRTRRHLQLIVFGMVVVSVLFMIEGLLDLHNNVMPSPFIYGEFLARRIRGLGFVSDPNDFAQVMVSLIPAMFLWRSKKSTIANFFLLGVPIGLLLVGMFYTHSRGGALALMAVIVVSARRKIGTIPAVTIAGVLSVAVFAVGWSGGRDVSMEAGADRLDLWYDGLQLIKAHPLFGVGMGGFTDAFGMTAHNSVVVCAAEIGVIGLFFWVLLLFTTIRGGILLGETGVVAKTQEEEEEGSLPHWMRVEKRDEAIPEEATIAPAEGLPISGFPVVEMSHDDIREMARILLVSLTGFLTAGWFLSRALSLWLFMYCGMMYAVMRMGTERGLAPEKDTAVFQMRWTAIITAGLIAAVSVIVRLRYL